MGIFKSCPECGAEIPADAPADVCPNCLSEGLFATDGLPQRVKKSADSRVIPPGPAELNAYFPDLEILEFHGQGGMGVVYKARQKRLDRLVALKILAPHIASDVAFAERFACEAKAMALLSHPHIVAVYEFGQTQVPLRLWESSNAKPTEHAGSVLGSTDSRSLHPSAVPSNAETTGTLYYFLMEFVDGVNLRQLLETQKLSAEQALAIVPQICDALQYAHNKGIVHRDIKPANILLDKEGQVKIADFGIAKLAARSVGKNANDSAKGSGTTTADVTLSLTPGLTAAGQLIGTRDYMAPEQIEHPQAVDHRADLYSLGVVFYQMLTDELPTGHFEPPSRKVQLDVRIDEIVLRALEKQPEQRYGQASEIKDEVETYVTGARTDRNRTVGPSLTNKAAVSRHPRRRQLAVLSAIALPLIGLIGYLSFAQLAVFGPPAAMATSRAAALPVSEAAKAVPEVARPAVAPPFAAKLPCGVTVELLGISRHPSNERDWWRPDGSVLSKPPNVLLRQLLNKSKEHVGESWLVPGPAVANSPYDRVVVVRLQNVPTSPVACRFRIPAGRWFSIPAPPISAQQEGELVYFAPVWVGAIPTERAAVTVECGVAVGEWRTISEHEKNGSYGTPSSLMSAPRETANRQVVVSFTVPHDDREVQVVAIDPDKHEHLPASFQGNIAGRMSQFTATFRDISLSQIEHFRVQTRPFQWAVFRNVAMASGLKTDVRISLGDTRDSDGPNTANRVISPVKLPARSDKPSAQQTPRTDSVEVLRFSDKPPAISCRSATNCIWWRYPPAGS